MTKYLVTVINDQHVLSEHEFSSKKHALSFFKRLQADETVLSSEIEEI